MERETGRHFSIRRWFDGDGVIWGIMIFLCVSSMVLIYSAASNQLFSPTERHNLMPYIRSHGFFLLLGIVVAALVQHVDYRRIAPYSRLGYMVALALLLTTILMGHGSGGVQRSLSVFGVEVQTFYIVVMLVIVYAAHAIARFGKGINDIRKVYLPFLLMIGIACGGLMSQNVSTGVILLCTCLFMLFVSELKFKYLLCTIGVLAAVFVLLVATSGFGIRALDRFQTVHARVERFFDKSADKDVRSRVAEMRDSDVDNIRQEVQVEGAVSTGGILPLNGPGNSIYSKTPQIYSDCIFAIAVEEYGVLISCLLIFAYLLLFYRIFLMLRNVPTPFGAYLAGGLGFWIVFQALVHISVCVGVSPNTGQTLPMVSWGNASIMVTSVCFGLLLNISKSKRKSEKQPMKGEENE
ncbi:MAG: FtsW/RodA/SpoVE family cell cycle protein [Bacteroidales bacterium]|nr:FtsW/RodA/SpoVE family cell cycle protein [Bacteroidales bacterium]